MAAARESAWLAGFLLLAVCAAARAQTADEPAQAPYQPELDEIVVTGSSIRGVASTGSQAVAIDRDEMAATGLPTTSDLARALPQVLGLGADESRLSGAQDAAANTTRISGINLRGVGNEATLVLLNGRRFAPAGVIKAAWDPNVIPASAIERIEVVVDGASAIYGSDAVAGVVNLITRKDFRGAETQLRYGFGDEVDQKILSQTFGATWAAGSAFLAYEYNDRSDLSGIDRDFATQDLRARGGQDLRSTLAGPGNIVSAGTRYPLPPGDGTGVTPAQLVPGTPNRFDQGTFADLLPSQERHSVFLDARHQIGRAELWYQGFYTDRDFDERVAPASGQLIVPNTNAFFVAPATFVNPMSVNVEYRFLAEDADPRLVGFETAFQNAAGVLFDLGGNWQLNAYASLSENEGFQSRGAITNGAALTAALASSNPAVAFNPYGNGTSNLTRIPGTVDIIIANRDTSATSKSDDFAVQADGPLVDLPGGAMRLSVGVERHENEFRQQLDATNVLASGAVVTKNVLNKRHSNAVFAELFVPIVGGGNGVAGVRRLALSLAGRYEDYSDWGETTNPKFGLTWAPVDALNLRATYGTSFRAPSLVDTSEQIHNIFIQNLTDPTSGTGVTRGIYHNGGRSTIEPEEADTLSFGFDWQPLGVLEGLKLSATWYDITYEDRIDLVPNTALTNAAVYAPYIVRRPNPADAAATAAFNALVAEFLANPDLQSPVEPVTNINAIVDGRRDNVGALEQQGVDVDLQYAFDTSAGDWRVGLYAAKITDLTRATAPGLPLIDVLDTFGNALDLRARASLGWQLRGWSAHTFVNYADGYRNTAVNPNVEVDDYTTVDASLSYAFPSAGNLLENVVVSASAQNLFDEDPPIVINGTASWDNQVASPMGRLVSVWVSKSW